jgi:hypothetical protein
VAFELRRGNRSSWQETFMTLVEIPDFGRTRQDRAYARLYAQLERVERLLFSARERERRLRDQQRRLARKATALAAEREGLVAQLKRVERRR